MQNEKNSGNKNYRKTEKNPVKPASSPAARASSKTAPGKPSKPSAKSRAKSVKKSRTSGFLKILLLVVIMLVAVFMAASKFRNITFSNVTDSFKSFLSELNPGEGYPYKTQAMNIGTIDRIGSDIFILGKDSVKVLSPSANEILTVQHTYSNAEADINNGRAIVFDRASGRFKVLSQSKVLLEKDMNQNILAVSIGKKGNMAIATKSTTAQSKLTVFDKNMNTVFAWECAVERISSVALSQDGKSAAVTVVGAKNAELYSKLYLFNFEKNKAVSSFDYPSTTLIKVRFGKKGTVLAVGDNLLSVINEKAKQKNDIPFGTSVLHRLYVNENGRIAIVLSSFGNLTNNKLIVYSNDGKRLFEKDIAETVNWVACDENYTSVLLEKKVQSFNNKGEKTGEFSVSQEAEKVIPNGKNTYVLSNGEIDKYATVGVNQ